MNSAPSEPPVLGSTTPRIWTPPLRDLGTAECPNHAASYGWDVIWFADKVLAEPLDPWQSWIVVHAGELLADGRPRFRQILILVARQNGKTHLLRVLALYWIFIERLKLIVGTSTNRDTAKETWQVAIDTAEGNEYLSDEIARVVGNNGSEALVTTSGCRYRIVAANRRGPRGWTVSRLIMDELREHSKFDAWNAAEPTIEAVPHAQIWAISNQGDITSVVLDSLRTPAITYIETGQGDYRLGLFEYSSPDGADPTDVLALAQANPNLGRRIEVDSIMGKATRAKMAGGEQLAGFQTETMCQRVHLLDPAIDLLQWKSAGRDPSTIPDFALHRGYVALCVDLSVDGTHASLVAACILQGKVHVDLVREWDGLDCTDQLRRDLPVLVKKVRPRAFGWFPSGPAAAIVVNLRAKGMTPPGVLIAEVKTELPAVCMGLNEQVVSQALVHYRDPMIESHVQSSQKLHMHQGVWVFRRAGIATVDGTYAMAGAVHIARVMPRPLPPLQVA